MPSGGGGGSGEDERLATLEQSDWLYGVNDWQLPIFQTNDDSLTFIGAENHTFPLNELKLEIEPGKSRVHVTVFCRFSALNKINKIRFSPYPGRVFYLQNTLISTYRVTRTTTRYHQ